MKHFFLIAALNVWALVLDLLAIVLSVFCFWAALASWPFWLMLPLMLVGLFFLCSGLRLHAQTSSKLRSYRLLLARNRRERRPESFEPYMRAPCGRMIVRCVLSTLRQPAYFRHLQERYGRAFFKPLATKLVIVPYQARKMSVDPAPSPKEITPS